MKDYNNIIRFATAGHVDDGKSTLIGRLLYDTGSVYQDQIDAVKKINNGEIDYSLLVEGLESERKQKITIDVAYRFFTKGNIKFIIADSPGHEQYTQNMAVAASNADIAVILIDASQGIKTQTLRHTYISHLFGIKNFIILINKIDLADYSQEKFNRIKTEYLKKIESLNIEEIYFIPVSALHGDNVTKLSKNTPWYKGVSLLEHLSRTRIPVMGIEKKARFAVQGMQKHEGKRIYQGRLLQGDFTIGQKVNIYPSEESALISNIIRVGDSNNLSISINEEIDLERGGMISEGEINFSNQFKADVLWFSKEEFDVHNQKEFLIKINHNTTAASITAVNHLVNPDDLSKYNFKYIKQNQIANVDIELAQNVAFDLFKANKNSGSFMLINQINNHTVACGLITNNSPQF